MANIPVGTVGEEKLLVSSEVTIDFLGMEGARVLSTPHMIGYMERTSRNTWDEKEKIGEGTHERAIIDIAKFATRLAEKLK
jgi:predicted thioesterase